MPKQLHQGVDADIGAGEFGGVRVPKPVDQSAWDRLCIGAGALECPLDARLQCSRRDALAVAPDEQRGARRPPCQAGYFCRSALLSARKAQGAAIKVSLNDSQEFGFDRDTAFFTAFAFHMDNRSAVVGGADVTDVGLAEFVGSEPC